MAPILRPRRQLDSKAPADSEVSRQGPESELTDGHSNEMDGRASDASRKVFRSVELMEQILLELNMLDILRCTLVCTGFRDVVSWSTAIQKKLFFIPNEEPETWFCEYKQGSDHQFILKRKVANACVRPWPVIPGRPKGDMEFMPIRLNPLFRSCATAYLLKGEFDESGFPILHKNMGPGGSCQLYHTVRNAFNRSASWRRMYISSPPAVVTVMRVTFSKYPDTEGRAMRHMEGAFHDYGPKLQVHTLGELVDLVQKHGTVEPMHHRDKSLPKDHYKRGAVGRALKKWDAKDDRDVCLANYSGIICLKDCIIPSEEHWALPDPYGLKNNGQL